MNDQNRLGEDIIHGLKSITERNVLRMIRDVIDKRLAVTRGNVSTSDEKERVFKESHGGKKLMAFYSGRFHDQIVGRIVKFNKVNAKFVEKGNGRNWRVHYSFLKVY